MGASHSTDSQFSPAELAELIRRPIVTQGIDLLHSQLVIAGDQGLVHASIADVLAYEVTPRYRAQFEERARQKGEAFIARGRTDMVNVVHDPATDQVLWIKGVIHQGTLVSLSTLLKEILGKEKVRGLDGIQLEPSTGPEALPSLVALHRHAYEERPIVLTKDPSEKAIAHLSFQD